MDKDNLIVYGYSVGDRSVGIQSCDFNFDLGISKEYYECIKNDKVYKTLVIKHLRKLMKEIPNKRFTMENYINLMVSFLINDIHDNGKIMVYKNTEKESD